jgi:hypothetical protein
VACTPDAQNFLQGSEHQYARGAHAHGHARGHLSVPSDFSGKSKLPWRGSLSNRDTWLLLCAARKPGSPLAGGVQIENDEVIRLSRQRQVLSSKVYGAAWPCIACI